MQNFQIYMMWIGGFVYIIRGEWGVGVQQTDWCNVEEEWKNRGRKWEISRKGGERVMRIRCTEDCENEQEKAGKKVDEKEEDCLLICKTWDV